MSGGNYTVGRLTPLPSEPIWLCPLGFVNDAFFSIRDPRVRQFPMMSWVTPNCIVICAYLAIVYFGPKLMAPYKGFSLKWPLVIYNFFMVGVSFYILFEHVHTAYLSNYTLLCQPVDFSTNPLAMRMARAVWLYFFTRYVEFVDTAKNTIKRGLTYNAAINCFIHVVMYTYYGLSALGPSVQKYLWWKVHLTKLQLLQFVCMLILMSCNTTCNDPNFPQFLNYIGILYCSTILGLFLNFYIQTYFLKKPQKKASSVQSNGTLANNGSSGTHKSESNGIKKHHAE
ncbi:elongation of very long chain fatty acids protein 4 [Aplysia californica]|uniref:Elongation of very long chain fatty acids protein n=1 Tax=Aplysia californica TaxID=6500 RepID=A0ABM0JKV5_APLCA|nr:elongation of very long chain fatty acids protein 4 [Aplysia californica]